MIGWERVAWQDRGCTRSTVGHDRGDRRRVLFPDRVRERDQGGRAYCCARETRGSRRGEAMRERHGVVGGGRWCCAWETKEGGGGVFVSVCYVRERTEGGGGYSCVVSFGKWYTEKYFVNHFLIFYTWFPINGNHLYLTRILQQNKRPQIFKTFSGKHFTAKQIEPKLYKKNSLGDGNDLIR